MNFTRRTVLQDAARLSLAAAATSSFPFLTSCHHKPNPDPNCIADNSKAFCPGIRVFFIGAWLFCKDPLQKGMLAITRDMADMPHAFPYGVWPGDNGFGSNPSQLCANPAASSSNRNAYPVTLPGFNNCFETVTDLFQDAVSRCGMSYISNPRRDINPDFTSAGVRVISIPFPTRLITAAFAPSSYVNDLDDKHSMHSPTSAHDTKSGLVASAYVFEYMGASSLLFNGQPAIGSASIGYQSDFHFHTVPPSGISRQDPQHPQKMFANLMSLIGLDNTKLTLVMPYLSAEPDPGTYVPQCVDKYELAILDHEVRVGDTASCAGGGHAVGDGG
jgi:hypothetical protein